MPQRWGGKNGKWFEGKWKGPRWDGWPEGRWGFGWGFHNLTDEEKTQLESMTDEEKQEFFETKRAEVIIIIVFSNLFFLSSCDMIFPIKSST